VKKAAATKSKHESITQAEYRAFQQAYDFFHRELFGGTLPHVLMTWQRHAKAKGYFSPECFSGRIDDDAAHELAMNPDTFTGRRDEDIFFPPSSSPPMTRRKTKRTSEIPLGGRDPSFEGPPCGTRFVHRMKIEHEDTFHAVFSRGPAIYSHPGCTVEA
jgi:hypothetical protein